MEIVDRIRTLMPDAAVTADVIVGFPGETEEQFQNTLKLMEAVKFDQLNTAAYRSVAGRWRGWGLCTCILGPYIDPFTYSLYFANL